VHEKAHKNFWAKLWPCYFGSFHHSWH